MRESTDEKHGAVPGACLLQRLALLVVAVAFAPVAQAEPFSLAGYRLGMPFESVLNNPAYDCESLAGCFLYSVCKVHGTAEIDGVALQELSLYFQGERLSGMEGFLASDRYDEVQAVLASVYGPPSGTGPPEGLATWEQGSQVLRLQRLTRPLRSSVILSERSFVGELSRTEGR